MWLAAAGALAIASSAIFVRLGGESPVTTAVFRGLYALPPLALLAILERRRLGPVSDARRWPALVAGIFFAAGLIFWHHAIFAVGAGIGTVLPNVQVVFVALIAWALLGERPGRPIAAAIPLALIGFVLISGVLEERAYGDHPGLGVAFGLLTAFAYASFLVAFRSGNGDSRRPAEPLLTFTASATIVAAAVGIGTGELDLAPGWAAQGWLLALALISQVIGWLLISVAMPQLPVALTSILLTLQPAAAVILAIVFLGEAPSLLQVVGMGSIVAGVLVAARQAAPRGHGAPAPATACC